MDPFPADTELALIEDNNLTSLGEEVVILAFNPLGPVNLETIVSSPSLGMVMCMVTAVICHSLLHSLGDHQDYQGLLYKVIHYLLIVRQFMCKYKIV